MQTVVSPFRGPARAPPPSIKQVAPGRQPFAGVLRPLQCSISAEDEAPSTATATVQLSATVAQSIADLDKAEWNACARAGEEVNPFLLYEFLLALEDSGSVSRLTGWLPHHIIVRDENDNMVAACPSYVKGHSYGEYVFDHSWANVAMQLGQRYYPKLLCAVPFTPVTGDRILIKPGQPADAIMRAIAGTMQTITQELNMSSFHVTFNSKAQWEALQGHGFMQRQGIQYHWENRGYETFDDFLMSLRQSKRKNIRQERKSIAAQGLTCSRRRGADIKSKHWDTFYEYYQNTVDKKWGQAYLTREFFHRIGETMPEDSGVLLATASEGPGGGDGDMVAAALNMIGSHALYGRNWGCAFGKEFKNLHFELCYYQALDEAIELGLDRVEAGAQGEHKIARGYRPSPTYSSHWVADPMLRRVIGNFLDREADDIGYTLAMLREQASPFKEEFM